VIYSGLDWSEDVGGPHGYMAMVHVDGCDLATLEIELMAARKRLGKKLDYAFKHTDEKAIAHHHFYRAIAKVPTFTVNVYAYSRWGWTPRHSSPACGDPCICDAFISLALGCPRHLIENQILYIDYPRRERDIVVAFATALRNSMKGTLQRSFRHIRPRPDDRLEGGIIQAADMIPGEIREYPDLGGPYLPDLGSRIRIV
jgi:hypothetical protein